MRNKLPWILFALSLAINLAFVAGAIQINMTKDRMAADPNARVAELAQQLGLSDGQRDALIALRQKMVETRREMRGNRKERRKKMVAELAGPELDQARVEALLRQGAEARVARISLMVGEMHGFLGTLSPEQKTAFLELVQDPDFFRRLLGLPPRAALPKAQ